MKGLGGWCHIGSPYVAEVMGSAGFDWCCVDMQHGLADRADLLGMVYALEVRDCPAVVRVPEDAPHAISHALDAGARAVIVPMVTSGEAARAAAAACHYPPAGTRSWGPIRGKLASVPDQEPATRVAECFVMIEDRAGLESLDEIARKSGVAGIFFGPADMGLSLWSDPRRGSSPEMLAIGERVALACEQAGIQAGVFAGTPAAAGEWAQLGFTMIALDADSTLLMTASRALLQAARATTSIG